MLSAIGESNSQKEMLKALRACYTMYDYVLKSREYLQEKSSLLLCKGTIKEPPSSILHHHRNHPKSSQEAILQTVNMSAF